MYINCLFFVLCIQSLTCWQSVTIKVKYSLITWNKQNLVWLYTFYNIVEGFFSVFHVHEQCTVVLPWGTRCPNWDRAYSTSPQHHNQLCQYQRWWKEHRGNRWYREPPQTQDLCQWTCYPLVSPTCIVQEWYLATVTWSAWNSGLFNCCGFYQ